MWSVEEEEQDRGGRSCIGGGERRTTFPSTPSVVLFGEEEQVRRTMVAG